MRHTDGTTWLQAGATLSLRTIGPACATMFKIVANERADTLRPLCGKLRGILISDRASARADGA